MNREPKIDLFQRRWTLLLVCITLMFIAGTVSAAASSGQIQGAARVINASPAVTTTVDHQAVRAPMTIIPVVSTTKLPIVYRELPTNGVVTTTPIPGIGSLRQSGFTFSGMVRERRYAPGVDINASTLFTSYPLVNHRLVLLGEGKDYLGETRTDGNGNFSLTLKMTQKNSSYAEYWLTQEPGGIKSLWIDVQTVGGIVRSNKAPSFWISYTAPLAGKTGSGNNFFYVTQYGTPTITDEWISGTAMSSSVVCSGPGSTIELLGTTGNVSEGERVNFWIFNTTHETTDFLPLGGAYIGETKVRKDGGWDFSWNGTFMAGRTLVPGHDYLIQARLTEMNYVKIGIFCKPVGEPSSSLPGTMTVYEPAGGATVAVTKTPAPLNTNAAGSSDPVGSILNFFSGLFGGEKKISGNERVSLNPQP